MVRTNLEDFRFRSRCEEENSGGVVGEEDECGDDVVRLLEREREREREMEVGYFVCEEGSKAVGERDTSSRGRFLGSSFASALYKCKCCDLTLCCKHIDFLHC